MRSFLYRVLLFCIPLGLGVLLLFLQAENRSFAYQYLKGDCDNRSAWMFHRIFWNERPADIVFIGSSRTGTGVADSLLETQLTTGSGRQQGVLNLSYCRYGINLSYVILKDWLSRHQSSRLVIEVRERERSGNHPVFPFLAEAEDLFWQPSMLNQQYFSNAYDAFLMRLEYQRSKILGKQLQVAAMTGGDFGTMPAPVSVDTLALIQQRERNLTKPRKQMLMEGLVRHYSMAWLERIIQLAEEEQMEIYFLYLKGFSSTQELPEEYERYQQYGKVLIPPDSIMLNVAYRKDDAHLNAEGARALSRWLAGSELAR